MQPRFYASFSSGALLQRCSLARGARNHNRVARFPILNWPAKIPSPAKCPCRPGCARASPRTNFEVNIFIGVPHQSFRGNHFSAPSTRAHNLFPRRFGAPVLHELREPRHSIRVGQRNSLFHFCDICRGVKISASKCPIQFFGK